MTERRWVLDTNTLVRRVLMPGGTAGHAVDHALALGVPLVSDATLDELAGVLAHEVGHVRRGDLGWGLVPALAHCVFWFHPFAHWCVNEYAQCREEACDAEALR